MSGVELTEEQIEAWRQAIRDDTFSNYYLSMGVAILCREGPDAALPWLQQASSYQSRQEAIRCAIVRALKAASQVEEARLLHDDALGRWGDRYRLVGLRELAQIHAGSACVEPSVAAAVYREAITVAESLSALRERTLLHAELATLLVNQGQMDEGKANWLVVRELIHETGQPIGAEVLDVLAHLIAAVSQKKQADWALEVCKVAIKRLDVAEDPYLAGRIALDAMGIIGNATSADKADILTDLARIVLHREFDQTDCLSSYCTLALQIGATDLAAKSGRALIGQEPTNRNGALVVARLDIYDQKVESARSVLQAALAVHGKDSDLEMLRLQIELITDQPDRAEASLQTLAQLGLEAETQAFYRALILMARGDTAAVLVQLEETLARSQDHWYSKAILAMLYGLEGRYADSMAVRRTCLEHWQGDMPNLLHGFTLHLAGREAEAAEAFGRVMDAKPQRAWFLARHFPRQFEAIQAAFAASGHTIT